MKVKELITTLQGFDQGASVLVSSDEELNTLFTRFEVSRLKGKRHIVIYGLSGSELAD